MKEDIFEEIVWPRFIGDDLLWENILDMDGSISEKM